MPELPLTNLTRSLTPSERAAVVALLQRGSISDEERLVSAADRERWLAQVPATFAGRACTCGLCPSVELSDAEGWTPDTGEGRVVLEASTHEALLMLFVDEDRLSYLELAPLVDGVQYTQFPAPERWL